MIFGYNARMRNRYFLIFLISVGLIYIHNVTRDIYSGDVGDIVTSACTWGVPHPTGYPLITFLGNILCHTITFIPPVTRVALISVFASLATVALIAHFAYRETKNIFIALVTASVLAFSHLFWFHAEIPEVFGLHHLFVVSTLYTYYLFYQTKTVRSLAVFAFVFGLSLTHHHTILLLGPACAILFIPRIKTVWKLRTNWVPVAATFVAGLLPYLYVPFAASFQPVINWGNGYTLQNFMGILQRKAYGGFAPGVDNGIPVAVKMAVMSDYFDTLVTNFSWQIIFVAAVGLFYMVRNKKRTLAASLATAWLVSGPLFVSYASTFYTTTTSIGIIERFYTMSYIPFVMTLPFGFLSIFKILRKMFSRKLYAYILLSYFLIVPAMQLYYNFPKTDLSRTQRGNDLARDILNNLPPNTVLFVSGDTVSFNVWYARFVLGMRPDVDIVNPPSVGGNTFIDAAVNEYRTANPAVPLEKVFVKTMQNIHEKRPIYATYVAPIGLPGVTFIPMGLTYKVVKNDKIPDKQQYIDDVERLLQALKRPRRETATLAERNMVAGEIPLIYSNGLVHIGDFVDSHYKSAAEAEWYYRRALWMDPENPSAYAGLSLVLFKAYKDCNQSPAMMKEAIGIYPVWHTYYDQLYIINAKCGISNDDLVDQFRRMFRDDLAKRVKKQYPKAL